MLSYLLWCHSCDLYHLKCFDSTLPKGPVSTGIRDEGWPCLTSPLHCLTTEGINQLSPLKTRVSETREMLEILNDAPEGFTVTQFSPITGRAVHMKDTVPQDFNLYIK